MSAKLGESLLKDNLITPQQLKEALDYQRVNGGRLASTLVKLCMLSDEEVTAVLSRQYGVPTARNRSQFWAASCARTTATTSAKC